MAALPAWLALFAPLPEAAPVERKPVATPELAAAGQADAIAGWHSVTVTLSDPAGLRSVQITLDANDRVLSASDMVMLQRQEQRGQDTITVYDHENVGGRFDEDGAFQGTRWLTHTEQVGDADQQARTTSLPSPPSAADVAALRALVAAVLQRAPARR